MIQQWVQDVDEILGSRPEPARSCHQARTQVI